MKPMTVDFTGISIASIHLSRSNDYIHTWRSIVDAVVRSNMYLVLRNFSEVNA